MLLLFPFFVLFDVLGRQKQPLHNAPPVTVVLFYALIYCIQFNFIICKYCTKIALHDCKQYATVFTIPTQFITNHKCTPLALCLILCAKIAIIQSHRMRFKVLFLFLMSIYTFRNKTISNLYGRTLISSTFNKPIKRLFNLTTTPLFNAAQRILPQ